MAMFPSDSSGPSTDSPSHSSTPVPLTDEARAGALWTFLQARAPRFTFEEALEVVRALRIDAREDHKSLAKRLRKALQARRIALKQVNALHAAARLSGHTSWHTVQEPEVLRLRLSTFENVSQLSHADFASWSELSVALRAWADRLQARGYLSLGVLTMNFSGRALNFSVPVANQSNDAGPGRHEVSPVGSVGPVDEDDANWLAEAPVAMEKLRRHLEENGTAVLDGYATLHLCASSQYEPASHDGVDVADVVNSELVLLREPDEDDPSSGFEIARGDELTCWHQFELSLRDDRAGPSPEKVNVTIREEGVGAWFVNGARYIWVLETLKPTEFVPGRISRQLGIPDCERLLRRYSVARRIHSGGFRHHDMTKRVDYLSGPPETWRVDLHRVLHLLKAADLTWQGYIEKFEAEPLPLKPKLPVGFVAQMLENLNVEDPNQVFAWPTLAEMEAVSDDKLVRSLMPRVDTVRYAKPKEVDPETAAALHKAVDEFAMGLQMQKMVEAGGVQMDSELPYLVYANDARELRLTAESLGMRMYVAVSPHLISTKGVVQEVPGVKMLPWAYGHALVVRFVREGTVQ